MEPRSRHTQTAAEETGGAGGPAGGVRVREVHKHIHITEEERAALYIIGNI